MGTSKSTTQPRLLSSASLTPNLPKLPTRSTPSAIIAILSRTFRSWSTSLILNNTWYSSQESVAPSSTFPQKERPALKPEKRSKTVMTLASALWSSSQSFSILPFEEIACEQLTKLHTKCWILNQKDNFICFQNVCISVY